MVGATETNDKAAAIPMNIWKMERAIKELPWYAFIKRWKMQEELATARMLGAAIGFYKAMGDLEKLGIITRVQC